MTEANTEMADMTNQEGVLDTLDERREDATEFLTIRIGGQLFGIPVLQVQDVLRQQKVTPIPLAPPEVSGALNLRGRIVTAINVRKRLGLDKTDGDHKKEEMSVVVEHGNELYSLIIDEVGDVLALTDENYESSLPTLDPVWKEITSGIYRLEDRLLLIMDVAKLLDNVHN